MLSVSQNCFYTEFISPVITEVLSLKYTIFCQILTRFGVFRQIFIKVPNIKFHGSSSTWRRADRQTDITKLLGALATM